MVRRRDNFPLLFQPVSIDVHLGEIEIDNQIIREGYVDLLPNMFCLGSLVETFKMPNHIVGRVEGKSTLAREGLQIHAAGLIDPGFRGDITLELKNLHHMDPYKLQIGELVGQVSFYYVDESVDVPYGNDTNHYQHQRGVTRSHRKII